MTGGFIVTKKMLDMFKRPDDPPKYYHLYGVPAVGSLAFYTAGSMSGYVPEINSAAGTRITSKGSPPSAATRAARRAWGRRWGRCWRRDGG